MAANKSERWEEVNQKEKFRYLYISPDWREIINCVEKESKSDPGEPGKDQRKQQSKQQHAPCPAPPPDRRFALLPGTHGHKPWPATWCFGLPQVTNGEASWMKPACMKPPDQKFQTLLLPPPCSKLTNHRAIGRGSPGVTAELPWPEGEGSRKALKRAVHAAPTNHRQGSLGYLWLQGTFWLQLLKLFSPVCHATGPSLLPTWPCTGVLCFGFW